MSKKVFFQTILIKNNTIIIIESIIILIKD